MSEKEKGKGKPVVEYPCQWGYKVIGPDEDAMRSAVKLCLEAGNEIVHNRIAVLSSDRFGPVIEQALRACGASVSLFVSPEYDGMRRGMWDALVVAEYAKKDPILGGLLPCQVAAQALSPGGLVVQFAGSNDVDTLKGLGCFVYPQTQLDPFRMAKPLSYLGPLPVVRLQGIGLKVGEAACRGKRIGLKGQALDEYVVKYSPAQGRILT